MGLSFLGIIHTFIGVIAIVAGLVSLVRFGKINLAHVSGSVYFYATLASSLTALGLRKHGFNPGHVLSLLIIGLMGVCYFLFNRKPQSKTARYWENFCFSFSFFLSMLPTVNETLTRVPLSHPIASGPSDLVIAKTLLVILIVFVAGSVYQFVKQRKINKHALIHECN